MRPGEKIKKLRIEKSMTQSELAGSFITRNMLSLIESGTAQPSLQTITYLAQRLNVPAGILVADDEDDYFYRRLSSMQNIRRAYSAGNYRICLDLCRKLSDGAHDDELSLIRAECHLGIAKEEFSQGHLKAATALFDQACEIAGETVYNTSHIEAEAAVYCSYMRSLSQSLFADCTDNGAPYEMSVNDRFCRYATVIGALMNGEKADTDAYLASASENEVYARHVRATLCMASRDHAKAHDIMLGILNGNEEVPSPLMYVLFRDLEVCCREIGDFKGAYEYAGAKVVMLERLLSDN